MSVQIELLNGPIDSDDSFNLSVVRHAGNVLLGRKNRGYGADKLVLPGGKTHFHLGSDGVHVTPGRYDVSRELHEETGLKFAPELFTESGVLHVSSYEEDTRKIALFSVDAPDTNITAGDELTNLAWYHEARLPYTEMPDDYELWLPHILGGYFVTAYLEENQGKICGGSIFRQLPPPARMEHIAIDARS